MAWRDDLRPASFRNVPFKIAGHELSGGRRGVQHQYAQRDKPYTEDTGRKGREFSIEGFIVSQDYFDARDALITALEQEGPGELIHPYLGRQLVNCFDFKVSETSSNGGMVTFQMSFVESGDVEFPSASIDPTYRVNQSADISIDMAKENLASDFSVAKTPSFVAEQAVGKIGEFSGMMDDGASRMNLNNDGAAGLAFTLSELGSNASELVNSPERMADQMAATFDYLSQASNSAEDTFRVMTTFQAYGDGDKPPVYTTPTRQRETANNKAMNEFTKVVAVSQASKSAVQIPFASVEDATEIRDQLTASIDAIMETTERDDVFLQLQDLRAQVVNAIPPPDQNLATVSTINLQQTVPSLVLAYDRYEDLSMESDINARNKIRHPGFVPGGVDLEVLEIE